MTAKELKRLSRSDLLEMLLELSRENDILRKANQTLSQKLEDRNIAIDNCGSLADAALQLNGIFEAAQAACEQYTENIRQRSENLESHLQQMELQTQEKCSAMLAKTQAQCDELLAQAQKTYQEQTSSYGWIQELMESGVNE